MNVANNATLATSTNPSIFCTVPLGEPVQAENGYIPPNTQMLPGQWAASAGNGYVLLLQTDGNLVLYQVVGGPVSTNSSFTGSAIWATGTNDGAYFDVQTDGNLVLGTSEGNVAWTSNTDGIEPQELRVQTDGNLVLYNTLDQACWASSSNHYQVWPPTRWVNVQSSLVAPVKGVPFVLTASPDGPTLSPFVVGSPNQIWQVTADGRLLSGLLGGLVLGQDAGSRTPINTTQSVPVPVEQTWLWGSGLGPTAIQNSGSNQYLSVDIAGGSVQMQDTDTSGQWYFMPTSPLDNIMALPASDPAFPAFTPDQQAVYDWINTQLAAMNNQPHLILRKQYTNGASTLDSYRQDMLGLDYSAFQPHVWQPVVDQLKLELSAASAVNSLFTCYTSFHSLLFEDQGALLSELGQDAGFENGDSTNIGGIILAVLSGVIYTVLSAETMEGDINYFAVAANVLQSGINVAVAAQSSNVSPSLFQVAYADLWGQLSDTFEGLLATFGTMETTILTDWAKLKITYTLIASTAPDGLFWNSGETGNMVKAAKPGYVLSVMQMLLPAKFQIYQYLDVNDTPIDGVPAYAQYIAPAIDGTYFKYWIADSTDWSIYPEEIALTQVWDNGGSKDEFFNGRNGWAFARTMPYTFSGNDANYLVIALTNLSPNTLVATVFNPSPTSAGPSPQTLYPYETVLIEAEAAFPGGVALTISIFDPSRGNYFNEPIASFEAYQDYSGFEAGNVRTANATAAGDYQLSTPLCNEGGFRQYPGAIQASIFRP
ncbi:calcium up-regulated protein [Pseudomonas frederiksbergensis]|uniref:hypothetical protein n=1 Tax=Pseudomonas frederiksbergensis TaxID=104087 RepID=UPI00197FDB06|nr:hypothetical protein [Pseudomonas frederiksbergensis]MBN3865309.1 calcium up-regulated protein [Pseudomonas frederiksbergensis]